LAPIDLIPVLSFIMLGGRCRYCHKKISWQYPIVEILTAVMFVVFGWLYAYSPSIELVYGLIFGSIFVVIGVYDLKHYLILDKVVFPALLSAFIFAILKDYTTGCSFVTLNCHLAGGVLAALIGSGFFYLQYAYSGGRWIGFGDVKLGLLLGMVVGWPNILALLFVAYLLGAFVGLGFVFAGKKHLSSKMPFGTFLTASAILTMMFGSDLINWYMGLIGY
jgi:prepilin signal peptidase PulO-like enzyme (type II secretory pathway)